MKSKYSERRAALLNKAGTPERRAALERMLAYADSTQDQFSENLSKAQALNIKEIGALAGPLKKTKSGKKT